MIFPQEMGTPSNNSIRATATRATTTRATTGADVPVPMTSVTSSIRNAMPMSSDTNARTAAAEQMRYQLYLLDRSQRRPSIEDVASALLDCSTGDTDA